tara:strand:+ start:285 stop:1199 length:915 start_codon:yes stop_codon:yes gene_type:complete
VVSKEEQELIELRKAWADLPLLNFWHDTNDAPDSFFDKLLASARGDDDEEEEEKLSRTTTRSKGSVTKAKSTYDGFAVKSPTVSYPMTPKKWGNFWEVLSAMKKNNGTENIPTKAQRKAGVDCLNFTVTKGLDIRMGKGRKGSSAFEKGPYNTVISYEMIDRQCNSCKNKWTVDVKWKESKPGKTCPDCRKQNDFKDIKGPYVNSVNTILFPVGLSSDGQTIAFMMLQGKEAKSFAFLKPGDRICVKGFVKGQWFDILIPNGGGLDRMRPRSWDFKKAMAAGGVGTVPLITLGGKSYGGYIKTA